jgi:hypothetical protein
MSAVARPLVKLTTDTLGGKSSGSAAPSVTAPPATAPAATAPASAPAATPGAESATRTRVTRNSTMLSRRPQDEETRANVRVGTAKLLGG